MAVRGGTAPCAARQELLVALCMAHVQDLLVVLGLEFSLSSSSLAACGM